MASRKSAGTREKDSFRRLWQAAVLRQVMSAVFACCLLRCGVVVCPLAQQVSLAGRQILSLASAAPVVH